MASNSRIKYECNCGAEDYLKTFKPESAPMVVNCYACGAGRNTDRQEMIQQGVGMFKVIEDEA
jgi:hypothetical protein